MQNDHPFPRADLCFCRNVTLHESYDVLKDMLEKLFMVTSADLVHNRQQPRKQVSRGSFHRSTDRKRFDYLLVHGGDTPVSLIEGVVVRNSMNRV